MRPKHEESDVVATRASGSGPAVWGLALLVAGAVALPAAAQPGYVAEVDLGTVDAPRNLYHVQPGGAGGDGTTTAATAGGLNCRRNLVAGSDNYMYFNVADSYAYQGSKPDLYVTIHYYDTGTGTLVLQYDSANSGFYRNGGSVSLTGSNKWKAANFHVTDAWLANRQNGGTDFRILKTGGGYFYLDMVYTRQFCRGRSDCVRLVPSPTKGGDGVQIRSLFDNPGQWAKARTRIDVLGTYDGNGGFGLVPNWELQDWMDLMDQWGLLLSMETGALTEWSCSGEHVFNVLSSYWDQVISNGGQVDVLAVDEPLRKAMLANCWGSGVSANYWPAIGETVRWYELVRDNYPDTQIFHIMPYRYHTKSTIQDWIRDLNDACAAAGVRILDAFSIDADWRVFPGEGSWNEVKQIESYFDGQNIPFSMIYNPSRAQYTGSTNNQDFHSDIMTQAYDYNQIFVGRPDEYVLQSWLPNVPTSVPETQSYTLTDTLNDLVSGYIPSHLTASVNLGTSDVGFHLARYEPEPANATTVGLTKGNRDCRGLAATSDRHMVFDVDDAWAYQGSKPVVAVTITYYDQGTDGIRLIYDSTSGDKYAGQVNLTGTNLWKTYTWYLSDAYFGNRSGAGYDFRLTAKTKGQIFYLDKVTITE